MEVLKCLKSPSQTLIFKGAYSMPGTVTVLPHFLNNPTEADYTITFIFITEETKRPTWSQ